MENSPGFALGLLDSMIPNTGLIPREEEKSANGAKSSSNKFHLLYFPI